MSLVECIANVSEGRRAAVVTMCGDAITSAGARLLDVHVDASHNRSVFSFAGGETEVERAALALFGPALEHIDLRQHQGVHPRIGAVDVVPFVPLEGSSLDACVSLARRVGEAAARGHVLPVFLYEAAASTPERRRLENVRRGQFEGLGEKLRRPEWRPDFGPARPHPSAGATAVGARGLLVAFNVNLATSRLEAAKAVARAVRESSGGLHAVKALGVALDERGIVQVAMNLTNVGVTPVEQAFEAVASAARDLGVDVLESEVIGLVPASALDEATARRLKVRAFGPHKQLEARLRATAP